MFAKLTRHWRNSSVSNRLDIALSTFRSMGLFLGSPTWEVNTSLPAAHMTPSLWQTSLFISNTNGRPSLSMSSMTASSLQDRFLNLRPAIMANRSDSWRRRCSVLWVVSQESNTSFVYGVCCFRKTWGVCLCMGLKKKVFVLQHNLQVHIAQDFGMQNHL